ncbi:MAG: hypothetical protein ACI87E_004749 [Mariniblastus sp.]|jgi:hypothetical protein
MLIQIRYVTLVALLLLLASPMLLGQARKVNDPSGLTTYVTVKLEANLDHLSDNQKKMIPLLIEAAEQMDVAFWKQAYGDRSKLEVPNIGSPAQTEILRRHTLINYGPWDRLQENRPFLSGVAAKPAGANFYPAEMTKELFEAQVKDNADLKSQYTMVRWEGEGQQKLKAIKYCEYFKPEFSNAAEKLREAAKLAEDPGFKAYLLARAEALLDDNYQPSDFAWMEMKNNEIDIVIGPIENYEDQLYGYKTACSSYVLIKDMSWSERLTKYAALLPELQKGLPVEDKYKQETPGTNSDLNAYDVIYYAGDCNSGSKTIAINLPNDEEVQLEKGSRRLQLKNSMRAKFDQILVPIADLLIVPEQRKHITFNAFFSNTMFHEVAHGLGIKNTITGNGRVRAALRESASALEEGKADILGLYMVTTLLEKGEITEGTLEDYYVTFMAGIFRSVRFGASSAHGKANMIRFNFFKDLGAFTRNDDGRYTVDIPKMKIAIAKLSNEILRLQGNGDYEAARKFADDQGFVGEMLKADLERVNQQGIPTDIVFEQGVSVLGLK